MNGTHEPAFPDSGIGLALSELGSLLLACPLRSKSSRSTRREDACVDDGTPLPTFSTEAT